ncbi:MAG: cellulase family glycosylhydrolase [Butyrivibrio sp.]
MKFRRLISAFLAVMMVVTSLSFAPKKVLASEDVQTNFTSIKYDVTVSGVTTETSFDFYVTTGSSWTNQKKTINLNGDGVYSIEYTFSNLAGMRNMGWVDTIEGSSMQVKVDKLTINGTYELTYDKTMDAGSTSTNGMDNIWGGLADGTKIATSDKAYVKFVDNGDNDLFKFYVIPQTGPEAPDTSNMTAANALKVSGDMLVSDSSSHTSDEEYNGYIQSNTDAVFLAAKYLRIKYTVDGTAEDTVKVFNFQPYTSGFGGWNDNIYTIGDSIYDSATETYTVYVPVADIKASLDGTVYGINTSFCQADPKITITSYETLTENVSDSDVLSEPQLLFTVTEEDLLEEGLSASDWNTASKCTVYVKFTDGGDWSTVNAMVKLGPDGSDGQPVGKASSKYLVGKNTQTGKTGAAIQDNLVGKAGTGNYAFPEVNLNKSMQDGSTWDSEYLNYFTLTVRAFTKNTDCQLLGIKFNNGKVYPQGFRVPVVEAATYDVEETNYKDRLEYALTFIEGMDSSKYEADSWEAFEGIVSAAKNVYDSASSTEENYKSAHASLEEAKANLKFVMSDDDSGALPFRDLDKDAIVYEMGVGTNLGNTMDGHSGFTPSETAWQSVVTTKEYIKALHDAGYNTVRIPVTWGNMIDTDNGYTINEKWMNRVQEIVDYCVSQDMYAIINIHHDGAEQSGWLLVASEEIDDVYYQFECVWRNIAERFKDYDEHLIFESMNEITSMEGDMKNSSDAIKYDTPIIMNLNQIFVNVVRSTGSNNRYRYLAAVAHYANNGSNAEFALPTDSYNSDPKLMFAAHIYKSSTNTTWTYQQVYEVVDGLKRMYNKFDVPMYLGEYGTRTYEQAGTESGYNDVARAYFSEIVGRACQVAGIVPVVWDQGYGSNGAYETGLFSYWDRATCKPLFKTIVDAMMRGTYLEPSDSNLSWNFTDITEGVTVTPITDITPSKTQVIMNLGANETITATVTPENTNDVVLWSTANEKVATVTRGIIRARGIGTTTVYAYSQNGEVKKAIQVIVKPVTTEVPATAIVTDANEYTVIVNKNITLEPTLEPANSTDDLTYASTNEAIATVNAKGKVTGIAEGSAYVVITASSGVTKRVRIVVKSAENLDSINLGLHVLYNDSSKNYWGCETGEPVKVTGNGTYTVSFSIAEDLSTAGVNAGITNMQKLTAIYIKDLDVTNGEATKSPLESADIVYDSVVVNGTPLTIIPHEASGAVKSGVFDSGKPINAWDGSVVEEVTASDHCATFTTISNPTTIEVTFTLSNVKFIETVAPDTKPAQSINAVGSKNVSIENVGDTAEIEVVVTPADTDSLVSFVSDDASIAMVDSDSFTVDSEGKVKATIYAVSEGETHVTAMTDNGKEVVFKVVVGPSQFWMDVDNEIADAADGDVIEIDAKDNTLVPAYIFESLKGKDITVKIEIAEGIVWTINGKDITTDEFEDMDLFVIFDSDYIGEDALEGLKGDLLQFRIVYSGDLGFTGTLSFNLGEDYAGKEVKLYYYNPETNELELYSDSVVGKDGVVSFEMTHASDWVMEFKNEDIHAGDAGKVLIYIGIIAIPVAAAAFCFIRKRKAAKVN